MVIQHKEKVSFKENDILYRITDNTYCKFQYKITHERGHLTSSTYYFKHSNDFGGFFVHSKLLNRMFEREPGGFCIFREVDYSCG